MPKTVDYNTLRTKLYKKTKDEELTHIEAKGWQDLVELLDQIMKEHNIDSFAINTVESNSIEES